MDDILQQILHDLYIIQPNIAVARDGGTINFTVKNNDEDTIIMFIDRRMRSETKDFFYRDKYPGYAGSIQLGKNDELVAKVEAILHGQLSKKQDLN